MIKTGIRWELLLGTIGHGSEGQGVGRLGGTASLDDFLEYKQISQTFVPPAHH